MNIQLKPSTSASCCNNHPLCSMRRYCQTGFIIHDGFCGGWWIWKCFLSPGSLKLTWYALAPEKPTRSFPCWLVILDKTTDNKSDGLFFKAAGRISIYFGYSQPSLLPTAQRSILLKLSMYDSRAVLKLWRVCVCVCVLGYGDLYGGVPTPLFSAVAQPSPLSGAHEKGSWAHPLP